MARHSSQSDTTQTVLAQYWARWEHRLLHGLACEWETALWVLEPSCRQRMRMPTFRIGDFTARWGQWSRQKREICLARRLIRQHSWDSVREVLHHEMAHQMADEVLGGGCGQKPHGDAFQRACRLLRANPSASSDCPPLDDRIGRDLPDHRLDRVRLRIKKLLALAESSNPHEAEAAMAKAQALMARHEIEAVTCRQPRRYCSVFLGRPALRHFRDRYHLASLVIDFFFVQGLWVPAFVMEKGRMGRVLEISGTRANVQMAGYVYDFVHNHVDAAWRTYNRSRRLNRHRKTDFSVGVIEGFRTRLQAQRRAGKEQPGGNRLPACIEDPRLTDYVRIRYPGIRRIRRGAGSQDARVVADGVAVGNRLVLAKGVHARGIGGRMLPP